MLGAKWRRGEDFGRELAREAWGAPAGLFMSNPLSLLLTEAKQLSKRQFLAKYPHPFLLSELIKAMATPAPRGSNPSASTETMTQGTMRLLPTKPSALALQTRPQNFQLLAVTKSDRNLWDERILIGRGDKNDLILQDPSVSHEHAYLSKKGSNFQLIAFQSLNPTKLNGTVLKPLGAGVAVADGAALEFGLAGCRFVESASLYGFLTS